MMLAEKNGAVTENKEIADVMSKYFINITENLGLKRSLIHISQPLESIIHVFRHHDSIQRIKLANARDNEHINFSKITIKK